MLSFLAPYLPSLANLQGLYVEPFLGGGSVFFFLQPDKAFLSDMNTDLMDIYIGIRDYPEAVWDVYRDMPSDKKGYLQVRKSEPSKLNVIERAARLMYLNRTCFKGMWRHNSRGEFNIGYGGQSRRWVVSLEDLVYLSVVLSRSTLLCCDFEPVIDATVKGDFLFLDPPYRPSERDLLYAHYVGQKFAYEDHVRLASSLHMATKRGVSWCMTITDHPDILSLYGQEYSIEKIPRGNSKKIGIPTGESGETLLFHKGGGCE